MDPLVNWEIRNDIKDAEYNNEITCCLRVNKIDRLQLSISAAKERFKSAKTLRPPKIDALSYLWGEMMRSHTLNPPRTSSFLLLAAAFLAAVEVASISRLLMK
jgi:hypothetical protein